eukprot:TRINITY_DN3891_c0_g1_i1.p1 TRINITY_DN3891_c0_g1~~TRINITY_DN3891_c0_g1_i1.p1  ORF type:complete len:555 (+),score=255.38 TRINITY_DN3891_c0_g1_i1:81-1745(+)
MTVTESSHDATVGQLPTAPPADDATNPSPAASAPALPAASIELSGRAEYTEMLAREGATLGLLGSIKAQAVDLDTVRAPVEICAVVDRSGSMRGAKLQLVKKALELLAREMLPQDKLGVVVYDQNVATPVKMVNMTKKNREDVLKAVDGIRPGGSTNLSGGLLTGMKEIMGKADVQQAAAVGRPQRPAAVAPGAHVDAAGGAASKTVWLFTDGYANNGLRTTPEILAAMDQLMGDDAPCNVYTFGFGAEHNEEMLKDIAEAGGGMYYFIDAPGTIPETLAECLGGLLTVLATDLTLTVTMAPDVKIVRNLSDPDQDVKDGRVAVFNMKDIFAEEEKDFVVEVKLDTCPLPQGDGSDVPKVVQPLATLQLSYTCMGGKQVSAAAVVRVDRVAAFADGERVADEVVDQQRNRVETANALREARREAAGGNAAAATLKLEEAKHHMRTSRTADTVVTYALQEDLDECLGMLKDRSKAAATTKVMQMQEMAHRKQRCAASKSAMAPPPARASACASTDGMRASRSPSTNGMQSAPKMKMKKMYKSKAQEMMCAKFGEE